MTKPLLIATATVLFWATLAWAECRIYTLEINGQVLQCQECCDALGNCQTFCDCIANC